MTLDVLPSEHNVTPPALAGLLAFAPAMRLAVLAMPPARIARQTAQGEIDLAFHTGEGSPQRQENI